jgi:asparagine synthase (glutamine-hydrolysing)
MCGITGMFNFRSNVDSALLRRATDTLRRRGPDDSGIWVSGNVGLGHRRLSIIDLSPSGHQPMSSADGRYVIVYNGEIYNFREIRKLLGDTNFPWRSQSDTEVILASYARWGPACVERFHGMFAFAIWDCDARALFAARDRMGVKPFYYHYSSSCFAFASRPSALLALDESWSSPRDEQALRFYMEGGYIPAPYSAYQKISKLPPAHWLLIDADGLRLQRYWDFRSIPPEHSWMQRNEEDLLDELEEIVSRSVRSRLVSDVPIGAFLSGGIDSSLVVAIMAKQSPDRVKTFTIGFDEQRYDESGHADAVARELHTDHVCERMNVDDLLQLKPTFSREFDEPFFDSSAFPTMAVSRLARKHVSVSLSGDGGDELFGGYHYYKFARDLDAFYRLPVSMRSLVVSALSISSGHRMKLLSGALRQDNATDAFCFARSIAKDFGSGIEPELLRRTVGLKDLFAEAAAPFPRNLKTPEVAMRLDTFYVLPDDYLQKVDVASMAFSLESREPLLDQDLVEWAMRLPLKWKLRDGQNKYLLRKLAYRHVTKALIDRPKKGFEVPIAEWLRGPLRAWANEELGDPQNFTATPLNQNYLLQLLELHRSGARQVHPLLWAALTYLEFVRRPIPLPDVLVAN